MNSNKEEICSISTVEYDNENNLKDKMNSNKEEICAIRSVEYENNKDEKPKVENYCFVQEIPD